MSIIKCAAARVIGSMHIHKQIPCQDYVICKEENDVHIIVLGDGAGSKAYSHLASEMVCESLGIQLTETFDLWYNMSEVQFTEKMIRSLIAEGEQSIPGVPLDTTLLAYAVHKDGRYIWCHIGDGAIFGIGEQDDTFVISRPENGMELNETFFVSGSNAPEHLSWGRGIIPADLKGVVLCSDGVGDSLWNRETDQFAGAFGIMMEWMRQYEGAKVEALLKDAMEETFRSRTADDMSIAVMSIEDNFSYRDYDSLTCGPNNT